MKDEPVLTPLGKIGNMDCYSLFTNGENDTVGRAIIDDDGQVLTKSTKFFDDKDICQADLINTFTKLHKLGNDHQMNELEY